jgi:hypothetical protein
VFLIRDLRSFVPRSGVRLRGGVLLTFSDAPSYETRMSAEGLIVEGGIEGSNGESAHAPVRCLGGFSSRGVRESRGIKKEGSASARVESHGANKGKAAGERRL